MREIKFRYFDERKIKKMKYWENDNGDNGFWEKIPPLIDIMQYTGLKDKNNKEIFEGDILKGNKEIFEGEMGAVEWNVDFARWCVSSGLVSIADYILGYEIEVIGNIYENKELLKV